MADDDADLKRYKQQEINNEAWRKHRRSPVTVEGAKFGIDVDGYMTEEGWAKFLDDMRAEGICLARIEK